MNETDIINNQQYDCLLNKTKYEVFSKLREGESNLFSDDLWIYDLIRSWWVKETILFIEFEDNMVINSFV
ncbi:TPA: hypothetical protein ACG0AB_003482 [Elizabethkingia anophelis]|uniref:Uncharacterized protein n=1 Tax=Elizabethkingia anophelis R26 TaxID=1246994 RepID=A0ABM6MT70_9FLAO|nr:hypothetical protein [Elizabethkingia anophelis]ATC36320.1 hypothetical protein BAZ09_008875 [Elizabethkingia anophelis R26]ATC39997.1 hypothetical protein EAAG1_009090 [Elizabethkingia anophelis Ag1]ATC43676.1 hypothetical protein CMV41_09090 [Elizabethkingia anophelis]ATC47352.1 hypothetical protein CMV40_09090 [Elizabethkingia anophelis]ELR80224.1 hypothetical protein D505_05894 [Elizabethkingia anophelis R26]